MRIIGALAVGILVAFFLDPRLGRTRRALLRDRTMGTARRALRRTRRLGQGAIVAGEAGAAKLTHLREEPKPGMSDETLAQKIMSEVFRDPEIPKGDVNVNVEHGVAVLRGQVQRPELVRELEKRVRKVHGVERVENLLHLPGSEAPMHEAHPT